MGRIRHVTSADGTEIGYRTTGVGEPILFVHGVGTTSADWLFVRNLLRDRFTVATMDRRGRGASGDAPEYAMQREAEDVQAVLDAVGAELLVGHSYGALCSILTAERLERLRRLVIYEPPIAVKGDWLTGLEESVAAGRLDEVLERFLGSAGMTAEQLAAIRASPAWPTLRSAAPVLPRELRAAAQWRSPAGPIEVPTLYLLGGHTRGSAYLDGLEELEAAFSDIRVERIAGQQHIAHVVAAETFAQLVAGFFSGGTAAD